MSLERELALVRRQLRHDRATLRRIRDLATGSLDDVDAHDTAQQVLSILDRHAPGHSDLDDGEAAETDAGGLREKGDQSLPVPRARVALSCELHDLPCAGRRGASGPPTCGLHPVACPFECLSNRPTPVGRAR